MGEQGKPAKNGTRGRELRSAAEKKLAQTPLRKTTEKTAETEPLQRRSAGVS